MVEDSLLTDTLRQKLGAELVAPVTLEIEKGAIRRFCQAIGDPNPLWQDEAYARETGFGGVIAPPGFVGMLLFWGEEIQRRLAEVVTTTRRMLAGGTDFEYFQVVRPGDRITATARLVDAYEREAKRGKMLFSVTEISYTNQRGELVATERATTIHY